MGNDRNDDLDRPGDERRADDPGDDRRHQQVEGEEQEPLAVELVVVVGLHVPIRLGRPRLEVVDLRLDLLGRTAFDVDDLVLRGLDDRMAVVLDPHGQVVGTSGWHGRGLPQERQDDASLARTAVEALDR